jgi:hypothetical protein
LVQLEPALKRVALDCTRDGLQSAPGGSIGLRQNECNVVSGFDQSCERDRRELGRAGEG